MRMTFEPDVEKTDFLEIILTQKDYYFLISDDICKEFPMENGNNLNICVRVAHEE